MKKYFKQLFRRFFRKKRETGIRTVYFGIRLRILAILILVMSVIIALAALLLYQHQKTIIEDEKLANAEVLTKILAGPAEIYLDRDIDISDDEARLKYELIEKEVNNFKAYNPDIMKIVITDEKGRVRYSTVRKEYATDQSKTTYIKKGITMQEGLLEIYDPADDKEFLKSVKNKKWESYIAVVHPVFLKGGSSVDILSDYNSYYSAYHNATTRKAKDEIYRKLYSKYKDALGDDFSDKPKPAPEKNKVTKGKRKSVKVEEAKPKEQADEISRIGDIDFLFQRMIISALQQRGRKEIRLKKNLVSDKWLFDLKKKKDEARKADILSRENEISAEIQKNISELASVLELSRRLGTISIVFSTDKIEKERQKIMSSIVLPLIGPVKGTYFIAFIFLLTAAAFLTVINFMVKNLKNLERWALDVGEGNLGTRIDIKTRDEIGRLGDVFNKMLDEIVQKYHLEKFVSKSTKSMIARHGANSNKIDLGANARKNLAFVFSDVRGFTSFSEKHDPETVINVLNTYLELQSHIVKENRGDIDDYVGDQIMAHFSGERRADLAIDTAVKITKAIRALNIERKKQGLPIFEVGIGVHGGDVVTGNVGSEFRMDFTCVGDTVNLSSRLCSSAKADEILVSQELFLTAKKRYPHEVIDPLSVKGKKDAIPVVKLKI